MQDFVENIYELQVLIEIERILIINVDFIDMPFPLILIYKTHG